MLFDSSLTAIYIKYNENYHLLEGVNYIKISCNNQFVEDFSLRNDNWKKYFNHPSKQSLTLSVQGILSDHGFSIFRHAIIPDYLSCKISFASGESILGNFLINNFEKINEINQEISYKLTLLSSGEVEKVNS